MQELSPLPSGPIPDKPSVLHQPIRLCDTLGMRFDISVAEVWTILRNPRSLLFLGLVLLLLLANDPPGLLAHLSIWSAALLWPLWLTIYLSFYLIGLIVLSRVQMWMPRLIAPMPILCGASMLPTVALSEQMALVMDDNMDDLLYLPRLVLYYLVVQVVDTLYVHFVLPPLRVTQTEARTLRIGPHVVAFTDVRFISAQEHFVCAHLADREIMHRARLSDVLAQTTPKDGIQPHRSWWVSRGAAPELVRKDDGKDMLRLRCGTEVPLARGRAGEVASWLGQTSRDA